jgi:V8-like Glu-specific endopeptidase
MTNDQASMTKVLVVALVLSMTVSTRAKADNFITRSLFGRSDATPVWSSAPAEPHPAVVRIIVPEGNATSYGSGTLIDVREQYGLVVTNWHVVRDSTGLIEVVFPNGFRSQARALKADHDWDLAALVIWRPPVEPVPLADRAPQPGDALTIHGYGQGQYRIATGRCTQYCAPRTDFPAELVELNVEARQGDSGGPIFNSKGELAGVLFGAGRGTTIGSFGGRVNNFLATLAPDIGQKGSELFIASKNSSDPFCKTCPNGTCRINRDSDSPIPLAQLGRPLPSPEGNTGSESWTSAATEKPSLHPVESVTENASMVGPTTNRSLVDQAIGLLAIVGAVALVLQFVRLAK